MTRIRTSVLAGSSSIERRITECHSPKLPCKHSFLADLELSTCGDDLAYEGNVLDDLRNHLCRNLLPRRILPCFETSIAGHFHFLPFSKLSVLSRLDNPIMHDIVNHRTIIM